MAHLNLSEKHNRIYLVEMGDISKILVYDLSGKYIEDIPLTYKLHKGRIKIHPDKTLTITSLPWRGDETPLYLLSSRLTILMKKFRYTHIMSYLIIILLNCMRR